MEKKELLLRFEVDEQELRTLRTHSLQRVLQAVLDARSREDLETAQEEVKDVIVLASRLWYTASATD